MKKYIVIYRGSPDAWKDGTKEEHEKEMKKWMIWAEKCGDGLVDMGNPLGNGKKVSSSGISSSQSNVLGYSVLQAKNMEKAQKMLENHPHLGMEGCDIEVYEAVPMSK